MTTARVISDTPFLLQNAAWPVFLVDGGGTIRRANQAAINLFGPKLEHDSVMLSALWAEESESVEQFLARWERSAPTVAPLKLLSKGAAVTLFSAHIATFHCDMEKRLVFQLFQESLQIPGESKGPGIDPGLAHKQKLDCALQLARTVALDFNNALTSILGHASLVLSKMEPAHPWRNSLMEMERAAERAAEITHQLATFSRAEKESQGLVAANLNAVLRRVVESFQGPKTARITWTFDLENRVYSAKFDEAKVQQVFSKVLENAVEAMGESGQIVVASRNLDVTEVIHDGAVSLQPGCYVYTEITDTGRGIEPEVLPRIFEPFFSTKPGHRGLGLAWVYGIITNHGGGVVVASGVSQGTSVRIYLPATQKILLEKARTTTDFRGEQTILLVDDEELVLNMGQTILAAFGYQVLTASNGAKALEILASGSSVDLVITDLVMPQMSGRELMDQILTRFPALPILSTSGYVRASSKENPTTFLQKPFTSQELLWRVKQLLSVSEAS